MADSESLNTDNSIFGSLMNNFGVVKIDRFKILKWQSPADLQTHSDQLIFITIREKPGSYRHSN